MRCASLWYPRLKAGVFALLACNTAYYLLGGAWTKALDALAWLTLLALFVLETGFDGGFGALKPPPTAVPNAIAVDTLFDVNCFFLTVMLQSRRTGCYRRAGCRATCRELHGAVCA